VKLWRAVQEGAGISRRKAQALIRAGEVSLDGDIVCDPYLELKPGPDRVIYLRGQPLSLAPRLPHVYLYNKPRGVVCSHDDPHTGNTLGRVLRAEGFIGYTWAGRLDRDAEGLMILTNDGALISRLTHPRYGVEKVYHVWVGERRQDDEMWGILARMREGITDAGDKLRILDGKLDGKRIIITLGQGHKHEIKRLFAHFGLSVIRLRRVAIGPIRLPPELSPGGIRHLTAPDAPRLYAAVGLEPPADL